MMIAYKCWIQFQTFRAFKYELQYDGCLQISAIIMLTSIKRMNEMVERTLTIGCLVMQSFIVKFIKRVQQKVDYMDPIYLATTS